MNTLKLSELKKEQLIQYYRIARNAAMISACFTGIVLIILTLSFIQFKSHDPINSPELTKLIEQVRQGNSDTDFADTVRAYDLLVRKAHFTALAFNHFGSYLVLGGFIFLLICLKLMFELKRKIPRPDKYKETEYQPKKNVFLQSAILCCAAIIVVASFMAQRFFSGSWHLIEQELEKIQPQTYPPYEAYKKNWPGFRGYRGLGIGYAQNIPDHWDATTEENILWKTPIPKPGFNSPVIWERRIFLSGADKTGRSVYCFDLDTGEIIWEKETTTASDSAMPEVSEDTGLAAPTMAVNGMFVSAIFATGELITLDFNGTIIWEKKLQTPDNAYGHASSLIAYLDKLFVQYDHGHGAQLLAFDISTGKKLWERRREVETSWTSPVIVPSSKGDQLILTATPLIISYDPHTGASLWQMEDVIGGEIGPSPAFFNDRVYFMNQYSILACVDIIAQKKVWEYNRNLSDIPSLVASDGYLIVPTSFGKVTCFNAETGDRYWEQKFETGFYASPLIVGDTVYLLDRKGVMRIFKLARTFESVSDPDIAEECVATPALADNKIIIRGLKNLYGIGEVKP